uniref:ZrgA family zinc uptake protein n=1 Tax=Microbulbifer agarilyticus TaxID=260552 RepID=UPI001303A60F|nr:DUF2796 domain-containing protein [Microbulbifer agarilyticus]
MTIKPQLLLLPLFFAASAATAQHAAHVHGEAQLTVAVGENALHIEFESPGANLVGFEHAPQNQQQVQALKLASKNLAAPSNLLRFRGTVCRLQDVDVEAPYAEAAPQHAHHAHEDDHGRHSEHSNHTEHSHDAEHSHHSEHASFRASYIYRCDNLSGLDGIDVRLFARFPDIHKIQAQWLTATKQGAVRLTSKSPTLQLK